MHGLFFVVDQHPGQAFLFGIKQHHDPVYALRHLVGGRQGDFVVLARQGLEHGEVVEQQRILRLGEMQVTVVPQAAHRTDDGADASEDQGDGVTLFTHCGVSVSGALVGG